jgi:hypothetical protein
MNLSICGEALKVSACWRVLVFICRFLHVFCLRQGRLAFQDFAESAVTRSPYRSILQSRSLTNQMQRAGASRGYPTGRKQRRFPGNGDPPSDRGLALSWSPA